MLSWLRAHQPVSLTGFVTHTAEWLTSSFRDVVYPNPKFNPADFDGSEADGGIAIYCTHGTADRVSAFDRFANRIMGTLPNAISSINLTAFDHRFEGIGIDDFAMQLLEKIKLNKHKKIILVGHSRGGLVNAYLTEYLAKAAGIEVVAEFAIGSPFMGCDLAMDPLALVSKSVKQMQKSSGFITDLTEKMRQSKVQRTYYAAENDSIVPVDSTYIRAEGHAPVVFDRHGHLSIMSSHRLVADASQRINQICPHPFKAAKPVKETISTDAKDADEYVLVDDHLSELDDAYYDIDLHIETLKNGMHFKSPAEQIRVFVKLQQMLSDIIDGNRSAYPDAITIDTFINAYLNDAKSNNGVKPLDVLMETLSFSLPLFGSAKPVSRQFIENLLAKYRGIPLRKAEEPEAKNVMKAVM